MRLNAGDRVLLKEPINCIPAGCYKFRGREGSLLMFSVGSAVVFGISDDAINSLQRMRRAMPLTSTREFITQYYQLLSEYRMTLVKHTKRQTQIPQTCCFLDPRNPLIRELEIFDVVNPQDSFCH